MIPAEPGPGMLIELFALPKIFLKQYKRCYPVKLNGRGCITLSGLGMSNNLWNKTREEFRLVAFKLDLPEEGEEGPGQSHLKSTLKKSVKESANLRELSLIFLQNSRRRVPERVLA